MASGYVYVLANSSIPGLVKVGKTYRSPSERAQELSGVAGVPTPFIVAFEQFFLDCDAAEDYVHAILDQRGIRHSKNREFFKASTNDVVRVILQTPGSTRPPQDGGVSSDTAEDAEDYSEISSSRAPWADLLDEAEEVYYGVGDELQDYSEALRLYKDAARLGSPEACQQIGRMYMHGEGIAEDSQTSLDWFREGVKRGHLGCHSDMATFFVRSGQIDNAVKCWIRFFKDRAAYCERWVSTESLYGEYCISYLHFCVDNNVPIKFEECLTPYRDKILARVIPRLGDRDISSRERKELMHAKTMLLAATPKTAASENMLKVTANERIGPISGTRSRRWWQFGRW